MALPVFIHGFKAEEHGHLAGQISVISEVGVVTIFNFEPVTDKNRLARKPIRSSAHTSQHELGVTLELIQFAVDNRGHRLARSDEVGAQRKGMAIATGVASAWLNRWLQPNRTEVVFKIILGPFHSGGSGESPVHPLRGQDHNVFVELSGFVIDGGQSITDSTVLRKERKGDHGQ